VARNELCLEHHVPHPLGGMAPFEDDDLSQWPALEAARGPKRGTARREVGLSLAVASIEALADARPRCRGAAPSWPRVASTPSRSLHRLRKPQPYTARCCHSRRTDGKSV
jgi:hypothetical protein